ncbi:unnamed protein product [Kuraishia capsulata CBS 1993]|uniref:DAGKc domain-containing protein n=1 Tax=Kuraishia capsulata CBS 1993 TaxID=1382522 RepID=W6MHE7_9ASCO|nr:uncharacterized protein KUCA_T00001365001 [Kuraishia capsulata CBS 1993]CDK25396.1 unnamed protein product [Kuraishia capsulata CBS 1993]
MSSPSFSESAEFLRQATRATLSDTGVLTKGQTVPTSSSSLSCCAAGAPGGSSINIMPYENILWAKRVSEDSNDIEITYATERGKRLIPATTVLDIDNEYGQESADAVVEKIMKKAYPHSKPGMSVLIILNPHGGQGKALNLYLKECKPILEAANCRIEVLKTTYHQHAIDIGREIDIAKYDMIACCSGDGIPYEIINGLYQREDRVEAFNKLIVTQLPCGSGNALSISCHGTMEPSYATLSALKSQIVTTDLMAVTQGEGTDQTTRLSFLSQTYGIIADGDIRTEWMRFMGPVRFDIGVAIQVFSNSKYPCEIYVKYVAKDKSDLSRFYQEHSKLQYTHSHTGLDEGDFVLKCPGLEDPVPSDWEPIDPKLTANLAIFYTGKMPYIAKGTNFFPAALPNDGTMDMVVTDSRTNVLTTAEALLSLDKGTHVWNSEIQHSKITAYRIIPHPLRHTQFSVDGEPFSTQPLQAEVLPAILKTVMKNGSFTETGFSKYV